MATQDFNFSSVPPQSSTKTLRVALYARISTSNGSQSTDMQVRELREYAERREFQIVKEYIDNGVSGSKASRPALNQLRIDAGPRTGKRRSPGTPRLCRQYVQSRNPSRLWNVMGEGRCRVGPIRQNNSESHAGTLRQHAGCDPQRGTGSAPCINAQL